MADHPPPYRMVDHPPPYRMLEGSPPCVANLQKASEAVEQAKQKLKIAEEKHEVAKQVMILLGAIVICVLEDRSPDAEGN